MLDSWSAHNYTKEFSSLSPEIIWVLNRRYEDMKEEKEEEKEEEEGGGNNFGILNF
jgi:hypothetical protein